MNRPAAVRPCARRLPRSILAVLAMLALASACSRFRSGDEPDMTPAVVVFSNQSLDQADVFAVSSSTETIRIGTVMPGRTESLTVPNHLSNSGEVTIVARLLASSRAPRSGPILLGPGSRYQVTLPMDQRILTVLPAP